MTFLYKFTIEENSVIWYNGTIEKDMPFQEPIKKNMEETKMKIYKEENLRHFEFWSGAKDGAARLTFEQLDQVENILEDCYPEGMEKTKINDLFWFDFDTVCEWLDIPGEDELYELEQIEKENPGLYNRLAGDYDIDTYQGAIDALYAVNAGEYEEEEEDE